METAKQIKGSIALIGMRACGKTTVGRLLAGLLGGTHIDTDLEVERRAGKAIARIFEEEGEKAFRRLEREVVESICRNPPLVIATGGGAVLDSTNRSLLKSIAYVTYLCVPESVLVRRLRMDDSKIRPPLTNHLLEEEVAMLLAERDPIYREIADWVVEVGSASPLASARLIAGHFPGTSRG